MIKFQKNINALIVYVLAVILSWSLWVQIILKRNSLPSLPLAKSRDDLRSNLNALKYKIWA